MNRPPAGAHPPAMRVPVRPEALTLATWTEDAPWGTAVPSRPFVLADGSGPARRATRVRVVADRDALWTRFDSEGGDPWATLDARDAALWTQEVVEIFLAPGGATPAVYYEFEVNPRGALFDARVSNPSSRRDDMLVDASWNCAGMARCAWVDEGGSSWSALLRIPWSSVAEGPRPTLWRANFFRIDRPRDGPAEFAAWSPTFTSPADFHKPAFFGLLRVEVP